MGTQAFMYYMIKFFISDYNIISSVIDVPLVKPFIYFYDSWYPFIVLNAFLVYISDKKLFKYLIVTMLLGAIFGQITFILYPSMVIRPDIEVKTITDWLIDFTYRSDTPAVNCLPSIHCVYCFVTSYYIIQSKQLKNKRIPIVIYSLLIVLSTVFVKQHIVEDIVLALIYTAIAIIIVKMNKDRIIKIFNKLKIK